MLRRTLLFHFIKRMMGTGMDPHQPIQQQRALLERVSKWSMLPSGIACTTNQFAGVPVEIIVDSRQPQPPAQTLLYLHGGAYNIGSPRVYRALTFALARKTGMRVIAVDYRLAPEHPCPAAIDDAVAVYQALLAQGLKPEDCVIAGDSAGAGLTVTTLLALREKGVALPAAGVLFSPLVDCTLTSASIVERAARDPILNQPWLAKTGNDYANGKPLDHPQCSPLFADLSGLPPLLIQVGTEEILFDDAIKLAAAARNAGVTVECTVWEKMWHVFQAYNSLLPEAGRALDEVAGFIAKQRS